MSAAAASAAVPTTSLADSIAAVFPASAAGKAPPATYRYHYVLGQDPLVRISLVVQGNCGAAGAPAIADTRLAIFPAPGKVFERSLFHDDIPAHARKAVADVTRHMHIDPQLEKAIYYPTMWTAISPAEAVAVYRNADLTAAVLVILDGLGKAETAEAAALLGRAAAEREKPEHRGVDDIPVEAHD